jgi:hypothetical protein
VALGASGAHHPSLPHADKIASFAHWLAHLRSHRRRPRRLLTDSVPVAGLARDRRWLRQHDARPPSSPVQAGPIATAPWDNQAVAAAASGSRPMPRATTACPLRRPATRSRTSAGAIFLRRPRGRARRRSRAGGLTRPTTPSPAVWDREPRTPRTYTPHSRGGTGGIALGDTANWTGVGGLRRNFLWSFLWPLMAGTALVAGPVGRLADRSRRSAR